MRAYGKIPERNPLIKTDLCGRGGGEREHRRARFGRPRDWPAAASSAVPNKLEEIIVRGYGPLGKFRTHVVQRWDEKTTGAPKQRSPPAMLKTYSVYSRDPEELSVTKASVREGIGIYSYANSASTQQHRAICWRSLRPSYDTLSIIYRRYYVRAVRRYCDISIEQSGRDRCRWEFEEKIPYKCHIPVLLRN